MRVELIVLEVELEERRVAARPDEVDAPRRLVRVDDGEGGRDADATCDEDDCGGGREGRWRPDSRPGEQGVWGTRLHFKDGERERATRRCPGERSWGRDPRTHGCRS